MTAENVLPVGVLLSSLVPALIIFLLPEQRHGTRTALNLFAAVTKLVLTAVIGWGVVHHRRYETRVRFLPGADLVLHADPFSLLFVTLSAVLWLATTIYAVGYLEGSPQRSRFFGFFSLCVASTMGIALAGNLLTFFIFYEMLTLSTYPLVVHRGTPESLHAGDVYLAYTMTGAALLFAGTASLYALAGSVEFVAGGSVGPLVAGHRGALMLIFFALVAGLGVKAALFPLHGWLPLAMVAPAPVSALLHAVAVVKAGAFGITRVVYDVYGVRVAEELGVMRPLAFVAAATVVFGSVMALAQRDLKRRLAYSTVSQVSLIVLGVAIVGTVSTIGGVVHLVHQGLMKITLFFAAGNLAEKLHVTRVDQMRGVGRRMPLTMLAFTIGALGMIGVPPIAGFVTKWYLGIGAIEAGASWAIAILAASTALNAAYFLPLLRDAWFEPAETQGGILAEEATLSLVLPTVFTATLSIAAGALAASGVSPLAWAKLIATREYQP